MGTMKKREQIIELIKEDSWYNIPVENTVDKIFSILCVSKSLPDHYAGELNTKRIKVYKMLHEQYNLEEGTVRDIFCKGADWYKEQIYISNFKEVGK